MRRPECTDGSLPVLRGVVGANGFRRVLPRVRCLNAGRFGVRACAAGLRLQVLDCTEFLQKAGFTIDFARWAG